MAKRWENTNPNRKNLTAREKRIQEARGGKPLWSSWGAGPPAENPRRKNEAGVPRGRMDSTLAAPVEKLSPAATVQVFQGKAPTMPSTPAPKVFTLDAVKAMRAQSAERQAQVARQLADLRPASGASSGHPSDDQPRDEQGRWM